MPLGEGEGSSTKIVETFWPLQIINIGLENILNQLWDVFHWKGQSIITVQNCPLQRRETMKSIWFLNESTDIRDCVTKACKPFYFSVAFLNCCFKMLLKISSGLFIDVINVIKKVKKCLQLSTDHIYNC